MIRRLMGWTGCLVVVSLMLLTGAWEMGAAWFDAHLGKANALVAALLLAAQLGMLWFIRPLHRLVLAWAAMFAVIVGVWLLQMPRNDRDWQPDVAEAPWAEIRGDEVTLHNVRNCDYRSETDYTPRWETRTVHLSKLIGFDLAICYWGSPWMAHPILSFQFSDAPPLCVSIETRKEKGESYSAIGGLFRQFELAYIVADERDVLRLRTNIRQGEDVYLYQTTASAEQARERFMEYLNALNALKDRPRWYNAVTTNCTTTIRAQRSSAKRLAWDWRFLLNGKADEMLFEKGVLVTHGMSFAQLKQSALINTKTKANPAAEDYSRVIRSAAH